ncbi:MAG: hypothetical protein U9M95_03230 [Candidatus Altiarchaeota archaeon]|nr:hypothetical protein [Candidatus Altiarchaeota archaeon]
MRRNKIFKVILLTILLLSLSMSACAEDKLKPLLEGVYNSMKGVVDSVAGLIFNMFPGLRESLYSLFFWEPQEEYLSWVISLRSLFWLVYIAAFIVLIAFLLQIWSMSKRYLYNTITGIGILLVCIHLLEVEIEFTLLNLILVVLLGIPGAVIVIALQYIGIPI